MKSLTPDAQASTALEALTRGYQAVPIRAGGKSPPLSGWGEIRWDPEQPEKVTEAFKEWAEGGATNIGLLLGEPSGGLVDVDVDHPLAWRLRALLPATGMKTGRTGSPQSHYWYKAVTNLPESTRRYKLPDGAVTIELRTTGGQTLIPPSIHPSGESYRWEGKKWGDPAEIDGTVLSVTVAVLALNAILLENWPVKGSRHEAFLALAGSLLRFEDGVHPYWERNLAAVVVPLATASHDDESGQARLAEVLRSTATRLRAGDAVTGWPTLAEMIGEEHVQQAQRLVRDIESLAGTVTSPPSQGTLPRTKGVQIEVGGVPARYDPYVEGRNSWQTIDLERFLHNADDVPQTFLMRSDGLGLIYDGERNTLVGPSEQGKTWVALMASAQRIARGDRVVFVDFEDSPKNFVRRLKALGIGTDDILLNFGYVQPDEPIAMMERDAYGKKPKVPSDVGLASESALTEVLSRYDPSLIVLDGTTSLFQLHGLSTNLNTDTDVIGSWLKVLVAGGRRTIVLIDHTSHGGNSSSLPIGSQHKKAFVTGSLINVTADRGYLVKGQVNKLTLSMLKDKIGEIRGHLPMGDPQVAAVITLDSTNPDRIRWTIEPPDPDDVAVDLSRVGETPEQKRDREAKEAKEIERFRRKILKGYDNELGRHFSNYNWRQQVGITEHLSAAQEGYVVRARDELVREGVLLAETTSTKKAGKDSGTGKKWTLIIAEDVVPGST